MVAFNQFQPFVENLAEKVFNLGSDTLKLALSNTAPVNTQGVFDPGGNHPPPAATNGYTSGGNTVTISSSAQSAGTYKLVLADSVFTASGGAIGPFRYAIIYDDTAAADQLIGWWDYGSSITLADGETFTWDADPTNGILTIA
jgi:hypothetical protein